MKVTGIANEIAALETIPKSIGKESGTLRSQKTSGDHPDNNIIKISQNTEKRLRETFYHSDSREKQYASAGGPLA